MVVALDAKVDKDSHHKDDIRVNECLFSNGNDDHDLTSRSKKGHPPLRKLGWAFARRKQLKSSDIEREHQAKWCIYVIKASDNDS